MIFIRVAFSLTISEIFGRNLNVFMKNSYALPTTESLFPFYACRKRPTSLAIPYLIGYNASKGAISCLYHENSYTVRNLMNNGGFKMSKTYDMIADSLNELISDYENHNGTNLTHEILTVNIAPARKFSSEDVRSIRLKNNLTQSILAKYLCVSKKTIEAWESGRNTPNGPSCRLLELLDKQAIAIVTA